jgi:hypothetical protein
MGNDLDTAHAASAREHVSQLVLEGLPETRGDAPPECSEPFRHPPRVGGIMGGEAKPIGDLPQRLPLHPDDTEQVA